MSSAADREKKNAALTSLVAALLLTVLKIAVGVSTGSLGVLAEAAHSALDLVAAGVTLFAVRVATRPADRNHAYGHGKAENLAALAETLLLLLTCGWIVHEAVDRLFWNPSPVQISVWAFAVMLISMAVDFNRARMLSRVAKKHKSQALEADALHFSTDIFSSAVVILGLIALWAASFAPEGSLTQAALMRADSVAALIVAVIVAWVSLRLGARAVNMLLDAGDSEAFAKIEAAVKNAPGGPSLKELRLRQSGSFTFADMTLLLPAGSSLEYSHTVTEAVEKAVLAALPGADLTIHTEPESPAGDGDIAARIQKSGVKYGLDVHAVEIYTADSGNYVTLHAVVDPALSLAEARERAQNLEKNIAANGMQAFVHIEPRRCEQPARSAADLDLPEGERAAISAFIDEAIAREPLASRCHNIVLLDLGHEWSLSFHCCLPGEISVEEAHQVVTRIEKQLHKQITRLGRISIHTDVLKEQ